MIENQTDLWLSAANKPATSARTLLIIDDDTTLNRLLSSALKSQEFDIVTAESAETGMHTAVRLRPEIILLDLCLPERDGLTVLKELRRQNLQTMIILTSCLPLNQWENEARSAGADDVLEKPYNLQSIQRVLGFSPRSHVASHA